MKYAYTNVNVLDGNLDDEGKLVLQENTTVLVDDDTIVYIGKDGDINNRTIVDLKGKYMIPGLINLHVHLVPSIVEKPSKKKKSEKEAKPVDYDKIKSFLTSNKIGDTVAMTLLKSEIRNTINAGITTIRTVGGIANYDSRIRDMIKDNKLVGPRMYVANTAISVPGGHMAGLLAYEATSPEDAREYVRKIADTDPDLIKLMVTGGVLDASESGEPGVLKMDPEIIKAACEEAESLGYKVASHTESPEGIKAALRGGVHSIEHGANPDREMLDLFKEKDAVLVATLSPALPYVYMDPEVTGLGELGKKNGTIVFNGIVECARQCRNEGITVGLGTDTGCPYDTSYDMYRELEYYVAFCDVSADEAISTATKTNARILGIDDITGTIEKGKKADLLICNEDPRANLNTLKQPYMVSANGNLIRKPEIKRIKVIEDALESIRPLWEK